MFPFGMVNDYYLVFMLAGPPVRLMTFFAFGFDATETFLETFVPVKVFCCTDADLAAGLDVDLLAEYAESADL